MGRMDEVRSVADVMAHPVREHEGIDRVKKIRSRRVLGCRRQPL